MKRVAKLVALTFAMCALCARMEALCEEMPVVVDEPIEQADTVQAQEDENARVKRAQEILIELKYLAGGADGIFGPNTALALRTFQRDSNLVADGTLNDPTMQALEVKLEKREDAKAIQQRLIDLGYMTGAVDGIFGEHSKKALMLFQATNGLEASGEINGDTRAVLFSEDIEALPEALSTGDSGEQVKRLQVKLIQFGFLSGEADGVYGKKTATAVTRFQEHLIRQGAYPDVDIATNGKATPVTQFLLLNPDYSTYISDIAPGEESVESQRVERRLNGLGYMDRDEKKLFDDYAVATAREFQKAAGLAQDVYDKAFIDALFSEDAPVAEHYVPHDIAEGDSGQAVRAVEEALVLGGLTIKLPNGRFDEKLVSAVNRLYDCLKEMDNPDAALFTASNALSVEAQEWIVAHLPELFAHKVKNTDVAEDARRIQRRLHTLYYLSRTYIDGRLGSKSTEALERFQETNGLEATGKADDATRAALFSEAAVGDRRPYRVEVDINRQRVYVYQLQENGSYEQIKRFICSTGLKDSTPRGIYLDGFPCNTWHYFEKFNCWAQYSFDIEGDIMFHSVLYSAQDEKTLRVGSVNALGSKASHGCIRLEVEDAKWLYENCKRGSLVILIY